MGIPENLFEFSLAYNSIGAIATKSVQSLRQLESLDLNNNQLTDSSFQGKFLIFSSTRVDPFLITLSNFKRWVTRSTDVTEEDHLKL